MKLYFDIMHPGLEELNFEIDKLDFTQFECSCRSIEENSIIPIEKSTFRDIFDFSDDLFYSEPGFHGHVFEMGSVLVFYKKDNNIHILYSGQESIRNRDKQLTPNPYGLSIDDFDLDSGNYLISIKCPGGFYCYELSGNPYNEEYYKGLRDEDFWINFLETKGFIF